MNSIKCAGLVTAALAVACSPVPQDSGQSRARSDDLIGIWTFETKFGTSLNGDLIVAREGSAWRATLSGSEAGFEVAARDVRFAFPGDLGRFRGALADDAQLIEGFWIRPGVAADPRFPGGSSQPFATPLILKSAGRNLWRGEVLPLEDSMTLYLRIFRDEDETLLAAFRNPDQHSHGGAMQFRVAREGRTVRFTAQLDHAEPEIRHEGTLVRSDALQILWPGLDRTIVLTRRAPSQAAAFFPRPPDDPRYVYRSPQWWPGSHGGTRARIGGRLHGRQLPAGWYLDTVGRRDRGRRDHPGHGSLIEEATGCSRPIIGCSRAPLQ